MLSNWKLSFQKVSVFKALQPPTFTFFLFPFDNYRSNFVSFFAYLDTILYLFLVDIATRTGHENLKVLMDYGHMFPNKQIDMADKLDEEVKNIEST